MRILRSLMGWEIMGCFVVAGSLLSGCHSAQKQDSASAFSEGVRLPEKQEVELNNGLKLLFIRDSSLPRINIMAFVSSGAIDDSKDLSGLSYLTASLLDEGSKKHSSAEIAEQLESLGASLSIQPGYDFTHMSIKGLSYTKYHLLDSFLEILLMPQFEQKELDRVKKQILGVLHKMEDDPDQFADRLMSKVLFQNHPYARPTMGELTSLSKIQRKDVVAHYQKYFIPKNIRVAVVGDFDDLFIQQVRTKFSTWVSDRQPPAIVAKDVQNNTSGIFLKNKKGLVQTQIRMGHLFINRTHPDFMALRAANMVLGGAFASRLNQRVRDDLGLTYGVSSSFDARKFIGPFMIDTFTRNDKVGEAISSSLEVYRDFSQKGITQEELEASKSTLIGQFPRAVETTEALAYQMLALRFYGIDESYLTQFVTNVKALTLPQVNGLLKTYFKPEQLGIVVYGDASQIEGQLKKLGAIQKL